MHLLTVELHLLIIERLILVLVNTGTIHANERICFTAQSLRINIRLIHSDSKEVAVASTSMHQACFLSRTYCTNKLLQAR